MTNQLRRAPSSKTCEERHPTRLSTGRDGIKDCTCRPRRTALIECTACGPFVPHSLLGDREVLTDSPHHTIETVYECDGCHTQRRFGILREFRPKYMGVPELPPVSPEQALSGRNWSMASGSRSHWCQ